jgi:carbamoyltransferase
MIADGNIVGWFQGRMEFGPRALGNRSLLADPRRPDTRAILNRRIKHREDFRPFAPSVLAERADEWFEVASGKPRIHAVCLPNESRTSRSHSSRDASRWNRPRATRAARGKSALHELISRFFARTGVPLVLNSCHTLRVRSDRA